MQVVEVIRIYYENNLEKLGNIYIYDSNLRKILEINNINTYNMTKTYSRLNGSLDFAIKNNILYYVTGNNTSRTLKYVDLNESNISEKVIESFDYSDNITRNKNIISINQFPYESSSNNVQTINGYDLVIDYSKNIMNISKSNEKLKEINFISWYINPNGFHSADLLGGSSSIYIYENKMYYLIDNKNNTISLKSINFNNELKEELIETFKFYKFDDSTNDSMIFGDCEPQRY